MIQFLEFLLYINTLKRFQFISFLFINSELFLLCIFFHKYNILYYIYVTTIILFLIIFETVILYSDKQHSVRAIIGRLTNYQMQFWCPSELELPTEGLYSSMCMLMKLLNDGEIWKNVKDVFTRIIRLITFIYF